MPATASPRRSKQTRKPIPAPIVGRYCRCRQGHHEPILADRNGRYIVCCDDDEALMWRGKTAAEAVEFALKANNGTVFVQDRNRRSLFHQSRYQAFRRNEPRRLTTTVN